MTSDDPAQPLRGWTRENPYETSLDISSTEQACSATRNIGMWLIAGGLLLLILGVVAIYLGSASQVPSSGVWAVIDSDKACQKNGDGIDRTWGHKLSHHSTLEDCQAKCTNDPDCMAVDWFTKTKWCNTFSTACTTPHSTHHGASSHRLVSRPLRSSSSKSTQSLLVKANVAHGSRILRNPNRLGHPMPPHHFVQTSQALERPTKKYSTSTMRPSADAHGMADQTSVQEMTQEAVPATKSDAFDPPFDVPFSASGSSFSMAGAGSLIGVIMILVGILINNRHQNRTQTQYQTRFDLSPRMAMASVSGSEEAAAPAEEKPKEEGPKEEKPKEEKPKRKLRVLSGVQPTGNIHLGNYLGAIKSWTDMQDEFDTFFCVVDLHAITAPHNAKELKASTLSTAAMYIACGIDPSKSTIFVQSHVAAHSQLGWLLNCHTPMNWLERMIQYKEKARKLGESVGVGLFDYPVLMAADILLYQADKVPVGADQKQHLELARDIATSFNSKYKKTSMDRRRVFTIPDPLIRDTGARVMSLTDGTSKMSKSDPAEGSRINLTDTPDQIRQKIKRCKTDAFRGIEYGNAERPECTNLLTIYELTSGKSRDEIAKEVADMNWGQFKGVLTDSVVSHLEPIQARYNEVMDDLPQLEAILDSGTEAANEVATTTLLKAQYAMGFHIPNWAEAEARIKAKKG